MNNSYKLVRIGANTTYSTNSKRLTKHYLLYNFEVGFCKSDDKYFIAYYDDEFNYLCDEIKYLNEKDFIAEQQKLLKKKIAMERL